MVTHKEKSFLVVYDGDCGFCQSTVSLIKNIDWFRKFNFYPFQDKQILEKYKYLTKEKCEKEIYLIILNKGEVRYYGGYDAFKIIMVYLPLTFPVSWFFFLPGVSHVGRPLYRVIAENRHRIPVGKHACKLDK